MANNWIIIFEACSLFIWMSDHTVSVLNCNRHSPSFLLLKFTVPWHKIRRWTWYVRTDLFAHSVYWVRFFLFFGAHRARLKQTRAIRVRISNWFSFEIADCADWCVYACKLNWRNQSIVVIVARAVRQQIIEIAKITQLSIFKRLSDCN